MPNLANNYNGGGSEDPVTQPNHVTNFPSDTMLKSEKPLGTRLRLTCDAFFPSFLLQLWDNRQTSSPFIQQVGHNGPAFAIDWHPEEKNWVASAGRDKLIKVAWQCFCLFVVVVVVVVVVFNALGNENFTRGKFGWVPILCVSCL